MMRKIVIAFVILMMVTTNLFTLIPISTPYGNYGVEIHPDMIEGTYEEQVSHLTYLVELGYIYKPILPKSVLDAVINFVKKEYTWRSYVSIYIISPDDTIHEMIMDNRGNYVIYRLPSP
jgi:hypothetical protein